MLIYTNNKPRYAPRIRYHHHAYRPSRWLIAANVASIVMTSGLGIAPVLHWIGPDAPTAFPNNGRLGRLRWSRAMSLPPRTAPPPAPSAWSQPGYCP